MKYALHVLKRRLQSEKHCALVHGKLAMDKRFAHSAKLAEQRIPQLEEAIKLLTNVELLYTSKRPEDRLLIYLRNTDLGDEPTGNQPPETGN